MLYNDLDAHNNIDAPKFPEDTLTNSNNLITNEYSEKNYEESNIKLNNIDDDNFTNNEFFIESNKIESIINEQGFDNYTDNNTEISENFIMKNYNTEINLTPYEVHEALIISEFLETHKTQLTKVGLKLLHETLNPNQLVAFFRNNHFNTLFKYENKLFILAADISFLHLSCTWELFDNVENDTSYYDNNFECLANQKTDKKDLNHSIIYSRNFDKSTARNNIYCLRSNATINNNKKKKKKKCTIM
ncbi:hypothetical protein PFHG_05519 [Plasmodium falciparum HB3]|nr:hypothetical protein PFHG_05519 [Plasmodium falciparum HB3]